MNEKLLFQFDLMKRITLNNDSSLDRLILESDFDKTQSDKLYDVLDEFSKNKTFSYGEFEQELSKELGWSYHDVKGLVVSLHNDRRYESVVRQYLQSNLDAHGNLSSEYNDVAQELGIFKS